MFAITSIVVCLAVEMSFVIPWNGSGVPLLLVALTGRIDPQREKVGSSQNGLPPRLSASSLSCLSNCHDCFPNLKITLPILYFGSESRCICEAVCFPEESVKAPGGGMDAAPFRLNIATPLPLQCQRTLGKDLFLPLHTGDHRPSHPPGLRFSAGAGNTDSLHLASFLLCLSRFPISETSALDRRPCFLIARVRAR